MIEIKELHITPDNTKMIISACIEPLSIYDNVILETVKIDNHNTFNSPTHPSDSAIEVYNKSNNDIPNYDIINDSNNRNIKLIVPISDLMDTDKNNLFYVYIEANVDNASNLMNTDCGYDINIKINPIINDFVIYNLFLNDIKSNTECSCVDRQNVNSFTNNFIKYQLIETALKAGKYTIANNYWNKYFSNIDVLSFKTSYSCNG